MGPQVHATYFFGYKVVLLGRFIFAHATYFFGYKVVLLGRFNGQGLDKADAHYQEMVRVKAGSDPPCRWYDLLPLEILLADS